MAATSSTSLGRVRDPRTIIMSPDEVIQSIPYWTFKRGKFGAVGEMWYISYQGKSIVVNMGSYDDHVSFPYGISDPYDPAKQNKQGTDPGAASMIPQGAVVTAAAETDVASKKKNIRVVVNESQIEYKMAQAIDEALVNKISENSVEWLNIKDTPAGKAKPKSPEMILENYNFTVRNTNMKGEEVPPYFGVKVNPTGTNYLIYTGLDEETGTKRLHVRGTAEDVKTGSYGRIAVKIMGLYCVAKKWGISLIADSIDVFQSVIATDCGFGDADDIVIVDRPKGLHVGCIPNAELTPEDIADHHGHGGFVMGAGTAGYPNSGGAGGYPGSADGYPGTDGFGAYPASASMMSAGTKRKLEDGEDNEAKRVRY